MSPKAKKLEPDLYQKFREMLEQAKKIQDPEIRGLALQAAHRYYQADIKQSAPLPMWALSLVLVTFYLLVSGTIVWAYSKLPALTATFVFIVAFSFMSLLVGAVLRVGGYISESSLLSIWKAGFKAVTSLRGRRGRTE